MHVCLFDIDGTLIRSGGAGSAAFGVAMRKLFGPPRHEPDVIYTGRTDRAIAGDLFGAFAIDDSAENFRRFQDEYLRCLPDALAERDGRVLPGIASLVSLLNDRDDVLVGLLTGNMHRGARTKLEHYGLWREFAFGAFGDVRRERDDVARDAIELIAERLDGEPDAERVWVIGDTPRDVACARAVGARAIAVATGTHTREELIDSCADLLLDDLADPGPLLELMG